MPTNGAEFHEEAGAEYDAAFHWYSHRSPDAAVKFDVEVNRAIEEILKAPRRWAAGDEWHAEIFVAAVSLYFDLPRTCLRQCSNHCGRPCQPEARILEEAGLVQFWRRARPLLRRRSKSPPTSCNEVMD
jgi:plasmid stabilization system protein ParE